MRGFDEKKNSVCGFLTKFSPNFQKLLLNIYNNNNGYCLVRISCFLDTVLCPFKCHLDLYNNPTRYITICTHYQPHLSFREVDVTCLRLSVLVIGGAIIQIQP